MNRTKKSTGVLPKVLKFLRPYGFLTLLSILLSGVSVFLTLYLPILIGEAIDLIVEAGKVDLEGILPLLIRGVVAVFVTALLTWIVSTINNKITFEVVRDVRRAAFDKLQELPVSYIDSHPSGDIISRIIGDVDTFADGLLLGFTQLFTGVLTILGTLIFMFYLNPIIALIVVVLTPLSLFVARFVAKHTYDMFKLQSETRGEQTSLIDEAVGQQKVVKAFGYEDEMMEKYEEIDDRLVKCSLNATFFSSLVNPSTRFVNSLVYAAVGCFGALSIVGGFWGMGNMTVGALFTFLSYANQYTKPFNEISGVVTELQNSLACAKRIFDFIEEKPQSPDKESSAFAGAPCGKVSFENVSFSYTQDKKLIEGLSLSAEPGQRIAIVGPTGCGKTTVINLLMRFYDVKEGAILLDGVDTREIKRTELRSSFGMVLQDTWLRKGSIKDNIKMGDPNATDEEVINAAKAAHAHGFIKRLPQGYDTMIGEDGGSLSQGQKQLLCIARVMLRLPPMLILDEATSSIDTRTETRIQKAFAHMMQGRTSFIVAHRLSTIREADVILVMRDGNVVEQGNHDELMKKKGFYAELYNSQFEET